jgi:hypothetical protein
MRAPQNAKFLSKRSDRLAPCLVAPLNMGHSVTFHIGVDLEKAAAFDEASNAIIRLPLGERSRILAIVPDGHHPPFIAAASADGLERMR